MLTVYHYSNAVILFLMGGKELQSPINIPARLELCSIYSLQAYHGFAVSWNTISTLIVCFFSLSYPQNQPKWAGYECQMQSSWVTRGQDFLEKSLSVQISLLISGTISKWFQSLKGPEGKKRWQYGRILWLNETSHLDLVTHWSFFLLLFFNTEWAIQWAQFYTWYAAGYIKLLSKYWV